MLCTENKETLAYIIGVAIGDGNLSNPNKRAVRLRVTCDSKYPKLIKKIKREIQKIAPENKVSLVTRSDSCVDISCYSNDWEKILGWKASRGPKHTQSIKSPRWIFTNEKYIKAYLRGLIETDGSIFKDRKYITVNFTTVIPNLADEVILLLREIGYSPNAQVNHSGSLPKHVIRIHRDAQKLLKDLKIRKT